MIRLSATTHKLQAVLAGAVTTNQLHCVVCYSDDNGSTYVGGTQLTSTNNTTQVDICAAPAASTVRDIDNLSIRNRDTAAATVTVMLDSSGADSEIVKATLAIGDSLLYTHGDGWKVVAVDGAIKTGAGLAYTPVNKAGDSMTGLLRLIKGPDIASAATVDLGTATGNTVDVTHSTGTTAITSLGGASLQAGTEIETRFVISGGTLTLTHHATNLYLAGGANITLANGDVIRWRKMHSSNAEWKMVGGKLPASQAEAEAGTDNGRDMTPLRVAQAIAAQGSGKIVQVVEGTPYTTAGSLTTIIPLDSTIPQNTEGTELTTVTITPTSASNRLRLEMSLPFLDGSAAIGATAVLFQDSTANAIALATCTFTGAGYAGNIFFSHEMAAGTTSATTFKLRAGPSGGTLYVNRKSGGETLGGISAVRLRVTEIAI